jgi:uncharacterized protein YbbK (DUF523 family)
MSVDKRPLPLVNGIGQLSEALGDHGPPVLVSACLLGSSCAFDLRVNTNKHLVDRLSGRAVLPVCPEEIAGLPSPRPPCHLLNDGDRVLDGHGHVITDDGVDLSEAFRGAAEAVLSMCRRHGIREAYLKSKSPSCGYGPLKINGRKSHGRGVTSARLLRAGVTVYSWDSDHDVAASEEGPSGGTMKKPRA